MRNLAILILAVSIFGYSLFWTITGGAGLSDGWTGFTAGQSISTGLGPNGSYGYWHDTSINTLSITVYPDNWNVGMMEVGESKTMTPSELIQITNNGNVHLNLGLQYIGADSTAWNIATVAGANRFCLSARFESDDIPPVVFDPVADVIFDDPRWATEDLLGSEGLDIGLLEDCNLWFRFVAPIRSSTYGANNLTLLILTRANLL